MTGGKVLYCSDKSASRRQTGTSPVLVDSAGSVHRLYLGSSITPLLRSVILGYFTFFWSSSF